MPTYTITKPYTAKSKPILFKGEMVKAILDGRKTQTRRVINPRSKNDFIYEPDNIYSYSIRGRHALWHSFKTLDELVEKFCPYGKIGDFLWVRETWATGKGNNFAKPSDLSRGSIIFYKDGVSKFEPVPNWKNPERGKWRPSIFMPRWASRISLRIVDIGVERIQSITGLDIAKEGIAPEWIGKAKDFDQEKYGYLDLSAVSDDEVLHHYSDLWNKFMDLWDSINAKKGYGWESNPWVFVISFERIGDEKKIL